MKPPFLPEMFSPHLEFALCYISNKRTEAKKQSNLLKKAKRSPEKIDAV